MKINLQVYFTTEYTFQNDRKIVSVVLKYKNHYLLKKRGGNFFMYFSFFAHRYFQENLWNVLSQIPDALWICLGMYKVKD